jgi:hypothetical protein
MSGMNTPDFIRYLFDRSQREDARESFLEEVKEKTAKADKLKVNAKPLEKAVRAMGVPGGEFAVAEGDNLVLRFENETEYLDAVAKLTDPNRSYDLAEMGWYAVAEGDIASQAEPCGVLQIKFIETHVADAEDRTPPVGERPEKAADQMNEPGTEDLTGTKARRRDLPKGIGKDAAQFEAQEHDESQRQTWQEIAAESTRDPNIKVYFFDELSPQAQERARHNAQAEFAAPTDWLYYENGRQIEGGEKVTDIGEDSEKVIVWVKEADKWEENGDGPVTRLQGERMAREIRKDCGCPAKVLPVGVEPKNESVGAPVKVVQCGSCGGYHRLDFSGDCREDSERFASPEDAEERLGVPVEEVDPESPEAVAPVPTEPGVGFFKGFGIPASRRTESKRVILEDLAAGRFRVQEMSVGGPGAVAPVGRPAASSAFGQRATDTWTARVKDIFSSYEEFEQYDRKYGVAKKAGWPNARAMWDHNPVLRGMGESVDSAASQIVSRLLEDGPEAPVSAARRITDFEFVDDGIDNESNWPGAGTALTRFHHIAKGMGDDPAEAFEDALDQLAQQEAGDVDLSAIEQSEEGQQYAQAHAPFVQAVEGEFGVPEDSDEPSPLHYYLSIRYNLPGESQGGSKPPAEGNE